MEVTDDDERPARQSPRKSRSVVLAAVAATCLVGIASVGLAARGRAPEALDEEAGPSAAHVARFADDSRPDIVLVFMDDVGMNDLWHSTDLPKPTEMSKLVRDGVELTSYYGQSLCSPARATLMTGKFAHKIGFSDQQGGVREVTAYSNFSVPLGHDMLPQGMKRLGYQTHAIGKWNIGHCNVKYMPWQRGFDTFVGYFTDGNLEARSSSCRTSCTQVACAFSHSDASTSRGSRSRWTCSRLRPRMDDLTSYSKRSEIAVIA